MAHSVRTGIGAVGLGRLPVGPAVGAVRGSRGRELACDPGRGARKRESENYYR